MCSDALSGRTLLHVGSLALSLRGFCGLLLFAGASGACLLPARRHPAEVCRVTLGRLLPQSYSRMCTGRGQHAVVANPESEVGPGVNVKRQFFLVDDPDVLRYTDEEYPNTNDLVRTPCLQPPKLAVLEACHGRRCTRGENHSVLGDREKIRNTCETH